MREKLIILGLDPGLRATGWGIIEMQGNHLRHVADGTLTTDTSMPLPQRLALIYRGIEEILLKMNPQEVAIEETFVNNNAQTSLKLGQARAASLLPAALRNMLVAEYASRRIKQAVSGYGAADKTQMTRMVSLLLAGVTPHNHDSADALAVAICHAHYRAAPAIAALKAAP